MGEHSERFWAELRTVYEAAGRPPLKRLVTFGEQQQPPRTVSKSSISSWLARTSVPGEDKTAYFLALAEFLENRAAQAGCGYTTLKDGSWKQLLARAQAERAAARGGRPRTANVQVSPLGPVTLPSRPPGFTGRAEPLQQVMSRLDPDGEQAETAVVVSAVAGMGGVGKTALALEAAHQALGRRWFPGGTLFADLHGHSSTNSLDTGAVADQFLRTLGVKAKDLPERVPEKLDLWRVLLRRLAAQKQPLLVVLDNAHSAGQVSPLLPAPPHRVIVTSRQSLSALPSHRIDLAPLELDDAVSLLDEALRACDPGDDRATAQAPDAEHLARLCGCLPLALQVITALLRDEPRRTLADQAAELADARTRLDVLHYADSDGQGRPLAVRAAFDLSYGRLTAPQSRAFRLLACNPGPDISTESAGALLDQPAPAVRRLLADLARSHLLEQHTQERWSFHDLVRLYADERAHAHADEDQRTEAVSRLLDYYLTATKAADTHVRSGVGVPPAPRFDSRVQAIAWLESERPNLIAAVLAAPELGCPAAATGITLALALFLHRRRYLDDWINLATVALEIFRDCEDLTGQGQALNNLGIAFMEVRRYEEAIDAHNKSLTIWRKLGERPFEGMALANLGAVMEKLHRFEKAIDAHTQAAGLFRDLGDRHSEGIAMMNLGMTFTSSRRFPEAIDTLTPLPALFRDLGDRHSEGQALDHLGSAFLTSNRSEDAVDRLTQAVAINQGNGDHYAEGLALDHLGLALRQLRRFDEAIDTHTRAIALYRELGDRNSEGAALSNLGASLNLVGRHEEAVDAQNQAVAIYRHLGDRHFECQALDNLGAALQLVNRYPEAIDAHSQAIAAYRDLGIPDGAAGALNNLGVALGRVGRPEEAIDAHAQALSIYQSLHDRGGEGKALNNLGLALQVVERLDEAIDAHAQSVAVYRYLGDRNGEARSLCDLGDGLRSAHKFDEAVLCLTLAAAISRDLGDRVVELVAATRWATALNEWRIARGNDDPQ